MDELILRYLKAEATKAETHRLLAWRREAPENEAQFLDVQRIWELRRLQRPLLSASPAPSAERLLRRGADVSRRRTRRRLVMSTIGFAAAASLLIVLGVSRWWNVTPVAPTSPLELVTNKVEMVSAQLGDGTIIRLAPESHLRTHNVNSRDVWLEGRAFFAVTEDRNAPFRVRSAAGDLVVLGTRFDVEARQKDLRLVVIEGYVQVEAGAARVDVHAGEAGQVLAGGPAMVTPVANATRELGWLGDFVAFESTPLAAVAVELRERFGVNLTITIPTLGERPLTGWFNGRTPSELVDAVCFAAGATCTRTDDTVLMSP